MVAIQVSEVPRSNEQREEQASTKEQVRRFIVRDAAGQTITPGQALSRLAAPPWEVRRGRTHPDDPTLVATRYELRREGGDTGNVMEVEWIYTYALGTGGGPEPSDPLEFVWRSGAVRSARVRRRRRDGAADVGGHMAAADVAGGHRGGVGAVRVPVHRRQWDLDSSWRAHGHDAGHRRRVD
jgi:hypothetical protein